MAVPSQVASSPRQRCRTCGRFVARGRELCARCSGPVSLDAARARLGLVGAETLLLPAIRPRSDDPPHPTAPALAPALRVVRAGRTRCAGCGRFVGGTRTLCVRCEADGSAASVVASPPVQTTGSVAPLPAPALRTEQLQESWVFQRTRDEYVVPRPSELHPEEAEPVAVALPEVGAGRRRPRGRVAQGTPWWPAIWSAAGQQRIAVVVVGGAAAIGAAVALFGSR